MTLNEYMKLSGRRVPEFAKAAGLSIPEIYKLLDLSRVKYPRKDTIAKITKETKGAVTINDFYNLQIKPKNNTIKVQSQSRSQEVAP